ncbi:vWA domain-containing protein [Prauserella cavernicola]|uniref:VWA domain-containing protein n=1 Tax=Prauserella cavernicola TaxID=2800127 RepID=A0A934QWB8_9PSEU|nr:VWA domain-containing protein [Prauserella cavernicola]MBK1786503.1 VWA domain-containing protein [Prauserella cavernicola]
MGAPVTVDPLPGFVGFAAVLREAGLPCDAHRVQAYLAAVERLDAGDPEQVYWAGRLTLCADPDDLPRYDEAFDAWFTAAPPLRSRTPVPTPQRATIAALVARDQDGGAGEEEPGQELAVAASDVEILRERDLGELTDAERRHLRELMSTLRPHLPTRSSSRYRPARRGTLDPRRTLRAMLADGGETGRLAYSRHRARARKLVLLVDVSGSMKPYSDSLLRFAHVVVRAAPANVEVFTLGTRLTRVSRQLRQRDPERAMLAAGQAVADFAGGTRLGETLRGFLDRWGQRGLARRSVVVLFSDGWERGDVSLLGEQAARLRRLAHAVFWVNPHAGHEGYAPVQSGIAAALPHIDRLLAGHSLATLERLLREIRDA